MQIFTRHETNDGVLFGKTALLNDTLRIRDPTAGYMTSQTVASETDRTDLVRKTFGFDYFPRGAEETIAASIMGACFREG